MGVPFASGHYLALRDFVATSVGPAYRAIWHRDPQGRWTIHTTGAPELTCPRYFGSVTATAQVPSIAVSWRDDHTLDVTLGDQLSWRIELAATPATRMMTTMGGMLPEAGWNSNAVLAAMGPMARTVLGTGGSACTGDAERPPVQGGAAADLAPHRQRRDVPRRGPRRSRSRSEGRHVSATSGSPSAESSSSAAHASPPPVEQVDRPVERRHHNGAMTAPVPLPRRVEVLAGLSVAIDLGLGQPAEHMLRSAVIAYGLADRLGLSQEQKATVYYTTLLMWIGCHADSQEYARWFGDDISVRRDAYLVDWSGTALPAVPARQRRARRAAGQRVRVMATLMRDARGQLAS